MGGRATRHALMQQTVKHTLVMAYDDVGRGVAACRTSMEESPRSPLRKPRDTTDLVAEELGGDGGPSVAHGDRRKERQRWSRLHAFGGAKEGSVQNTRLSLLFSFPSLAV